MEKDNDSLKLLQESYGDEDDEKEEENDEIEVGAEEFDETEFLDINSLFEVQDFEGNDVNSFVMNIEMNHHERDDIVHPQEEEAVDDTDEDDEGLLEFQKLYDLAFKNKKMVASCDVQEDDVADDADDNDADDDGVDNQEENAQEQEEVEIDIDYKQF